MTSTRRGGQAQVDACGRRRGVKPHVDGRPHRKLKLEKLNKLKSYSRISALGPVCHCTSRFKRAVCISCRPRVDVQMGGGGPAHVDRGSQKQDFFVDVINGWPLKR